MEDVEKKALELERAVDELQDRFEASCRKKEELFQSLGITPEMLVRFEERLSLKDRERLQELKEKIDREIDLRLSTSQPAQSQGNFKPPRGIRV